MKICGIEFPDNATFEFFGSPLGTNLSRKARLYAHSCAGPPKMFHITEIETELEDENALVGERCGIDFIESQNGNQEVAYAVITSGQFKKTTLFLKFEKRNKDAKIS